MKTIFRPNINVNKKKRKIFLSGALVALILIVIIFRTFSFRIINQPVLYILKPFFELRTALEAKWKKIKLNFNDKQKLQDENKNFREKIMQLEARIALSEVIEKEDEILKATFSAGERKNFVLASIIFRPAATPYDMLIIDAGAKNGIKEGMEVSAFGNVLLGYVADVDDKMSKVKMISAFGEETNVLLESSGAPAIAIGRGGENFEITLPRQIKIEVGERIVTFGKQPMLVGMVQRIEHQTIDPYQKILFRLPVNIQYLHQVFLLKK